MTRRPLTLLVDAPSLIYRAFFALPDSIRAPDGTPINAAHGFLTMLTRLISDLHPTHLACCMDADWRPQWRVDLVDSYKTHRVAGEGEEADDVVETQTELIARLLRLAGIAVVGAPDCEAEDVIATLLQRVNGRVAIVSGDRDLFQLVRDPNVWVLCPKRGVTDLVRVDETEIERRYGIPPRRYADFAVLRGDPSDGLPGVPGIGEKTAAQLISAHGSLEEVVRVSQGAKSGPRAKVAAAEDYIRRAARVVRMSADCVVGDVNLTFPQHAPSPTLSRLAKPLGLQGPIDRLIAGMPQWN